jgi:ribosome-binding protein aMBF1 (putative translation factor)
MTITVFIKMKQLKLLQGKFQKQIMIKNDNKHIANNIGDHLNDCRVKIGENIREIREKKGYSQEHLADMMKVSRTTISKIESGKFNFSINYLSKFSWYLDFDFTIVNLKLKDNNIRK